MQEQFFCLRLISIQEVSTAIQARRTFCQANRSRRFLVLKCVSCVGAVEHASDEIHQVTHTGSASYPIHMQL